MTAKSRTSTPLQLAAVVDDQKFPLTAVPQINSFSGSENNILLVFNGGIYGTLTMPPFDLDGDLTSFSSTEIAWMSEITNRVAEKYSPFNVNVTTIRPSNMNNTIICVIGGNSQTLINLGAGGWTPLIGSFKGGTPLCYVFPAQLIIGVNDEKAIASAISHEIGHVLGLYHQSVYDGDELIDEYNPGNSTKAPIIGVGYDATYDIWWYGQNDQSSTTMQDDIAVITSCLGLKSQPGNSASSPIPVTQLPPSGNYSFNGIVENASNPVYYSLIGQGPITCASLPFEPQNGAMLIPTQELLDEQGSVIYQFGNLAAGKYVLRVHGDGTYGNIGQFSVTGTFSPLNPPSFNISGSTLSVLNPDNRPLTITAICGSLGFVLQSWYKFVFDGNWNINYGGLNECWMQGIVNQYGNLWYFILPNGNLYSWDGTPDKASGTIVESLPPLYYAHPGMIFNSTKTSVEFDIAKQFTLSYAPAQENLYRTPSSWFQSQSTNSFGKYWYFILADNSFWEWDGQNSCTGNLLFKSVNLPTLKAYSLGITNEDVTQLNWGGESEKWLQAPGSWYYIKPDGTFYWYKGSGKPLNNNDNTSLAQIPPAFYSNTNWFVSGEPDGSNVIVNGTSLNTVGNPACILVVVNDGIFEKMRHT